MPDTETTEEAQPAEETPESPDDPFSWLDPESNLAEAIEVAEAEEAAAKEQLSEEQQAEEQKHEHELTLLKAQANLNAAVARQKELGALALAGDLRPSEGRELRQLEIDLPGLRRELEDLENATEFVGLDDAGLQDEWLDRAEVQQAAFATERSAEAAFEAMLRNFHTPEDAAVARRRVERAHDATLAAIGATQAARREFDNRADDFARATAEAEVEERLQAAEGAPQPAFNVGDSGTATITGPALAREAEPAPMVRRAIPLSEEKGEKIEW